VISQSFFAAEYVIVWAELIKLKPTDRMQSAAERM
jgi:hypothetical protein